MGIGELVENSPDGLKIEIRQGFDRSRRSLEFLQCAVDVNMLFREVVAVESREILWVVQWPVSPEERECGEGGSVQLCELKPGPE